MKTKKLVKKLRLKKEVKEVIQDACLDVFAILTFGGLVYVLTLLNTLLYY